MFYKLDGEDSILLSYLLNLDIKNGLVYISKNKIDKVLIVLDKLNINYLYMGGYHDFTCNKYDYYLEYAYLKYDIYLLVNGVYHE